MGNTYSKKKQDDLFESVCSLIDRGKPLGKACKELGISPKSFYKWMDDSDMEESGVLGQGSKGKRYARAKENRADAIFEEMLEIADTPMDGEFTEEIKDEDGKVIKKSTKRRDMYNHRRLQVDTRKFMVAKLNPKRYGEAQLIKIGDTDGNNIRPNVLFPASPVILPDVQTDDSTKED